MTENEKKIKMWRTERRNHCQFPTQQSYDDATSELKLIKQQFVEGIISRGQAIVHLIYFMNYGKTGATRVVDKWSALT